MSQPPLLQVDLRAGYRRGVPVLGDVRFSLQAGERLGLVGSSAAGKSTLVLALLGLLPFRGGWAQGEVLWQGRNLLALSERELRSLRGREMALVPQSPLSALNGAVSLRRHFQESWRAHRERSTGRELEARLSALFEQLGLPQDEAFLDRRPGAVSVGQAQRVALALALLHRPSLLLADEPTSALDPLTQADTLALLREANSREGTAILFVSHDLLSVIRLCSALAVLHEGRVVEQASFVRLASHGANHAATQALLGTLPVPLASLLPHPVAGANAPDVPGIRGNSPAHPKVSLQ